MFSPTPHGAFASSVLYSVQQSIVANGLDPYQTWVYILKRLPQLWSGADFRAIAPHRVNKADFSGDYKGDGGEN